MKKIITLIISTIIVILSFMFIFSNKEAFSENENRYLTKLPKFTLNNLVSGKFNNDLNNYLSDHFNFRNGFMNLKTKIDIILGKTLINGVYIGSNDFLMMKYDKPVNSKKIINNLNDFYKNNNYVNVELMLVPTSVEINKDKLPNYVDNKQYEELNNIYNEIVFNKINVYDTLKDNNKIYNMYYKLDHHWTSYGAYYAYLEYCKSNHLEPIDITKYKIENVSNEFKGTLYSKVIDDGLLKDDIYIFNYNGDYTVDYGNKKVNSLYDKTKLETKDKYGVFLGGNYPLVTINNNKLKNNKELVIVKDSYANSIVPFLINHFSKIHLIDPRYYNESVTNYIKNNKITDVLVLYNMGTIDSDTGIRTIK